MKDSTYLFLWDTCSETSMILKNQAKLRNIPIEMLEKKETVISKEIAKQWVITNVKINHTIITA